MSGRRGGCGGHDSFHEQMIVEFGKLASLVSRVRVIGVDAQAQALAESISTFFSVSMRYHQIDEERNLFPRLIAQGEPDMIEMIVRLQRDHDHLEACWMDLEPLLAAIRAGRRDVDSEALRSTTAAFTSTMLRHAALEESVIHPSVRATVERACGAEYVAGRGVLTDAPHALRGAVAPAPVVERLTAEPPLPARYTVSC